MFKVEKRKISKFKDICRTFTAAGACRLRADRQIIKKLSRKAQSETVTLDKKTRSMLFPWSIGKLKYVLGRPVESLATGHAEILNLEIPRVKFEKLFTQCGAYERLAKMDYPKRNAG